MKQDIIYILKNSIISIFIVLTSLLLNLCSIHQYSISNAWNDFLNCGIYTYTYCFELILLMIVLFEFWKIFVDAIDSKKQTYVIIVSIILCFVIIFIPIQLLFKLMMELFILVGIIRTSYHHLKK